ncbi:MAG: bifunctional riboflavin kinase/FAD synthetase [Myxococcota bacterium]
MKIYSGSEELGGALRGCILTVGNFDGLHLGHQALLRAVLERGRALAAPMAVYTFDPHPRRLLQPERAQPRLMTSEQLTLGLEEAGIDALIRETFTHEFASLSAETFLREILGARIGPREVHVGRGFHFGKGRQGSGRTLQLRGPEIGIDVRIIPQVRAGGKDVSSSRIRAALARGDVAEAELCLARPYSVWGRVVPGARRGRTLGFPTANLDVENELLPASGVYATRVRIFAGKRPSGQAWPAVTNIGSRPTFASDGVIAEAHLLDFEGDLYGQRIAVAFHARLREERRFPDSEALAEQIANDVQTTRSLLASTPAQT